MVLEQLKKIRLVPVVVIDDAADAVPLARALRAGGLPVAEVTFRTAAAPEAIRTIVREFPDFVVGAGTVTRREELEAARAAGAVFGVAPGMNPKIVAHAVAARWPFFPGVATPSEVEQALDLGCQVLKFFPASQCGGTAMLSTLAGVYSHRKVSFIPTGGINEKNFTEYLATKGVLAIGGSWMVAGALIKAKDWNQITTLTRQAVDAVAALAN